MTTLALALSDLLNDRQSSLETLLDRHFSDKYRQCTNGDWTTREQFAEHIEHLRVITSSAKIKVLDELTDGDHYAERHRVVVTKRDESTVEQEVYVFARLDSDGKFLSLEEVTRMVQGDEQDRNIGSAR
ncbi:MULTISPECIES: nuclear transport factor 2 family protein [unclassified Pseudoclavibacter]|uniref:nuclear transport factor 2 family protein n=1 Tax=unclassified Pseudoclavibacter TaxID=2615177 RepID=UPI0013017D25|nr:MULTISPECIES: nuclear transport factor 2 family protein [unclassified Pseudoclavibacter]KAB1645645.1 nuclear transport factor 2 family protein [Pseudoclavibacter sp. CFCC 14310]KAB1664448.1 nuclear transport factor 2 family protein [Pseudoclavibacter sp. CFCC 13611]